MPKKTLEQEINEVLEMWDCNQTSLFLDDIAPLLELYDVDEKDDWVKDLVGEEDERNVRLVRTVYLVSKIAERHASKLCSIKMNFKDFYKRLDSLVELLDSSKE